MAIKKYTINGKEYSYQTTYHNQTVHVTVTSNALLSTILKVTVHTIDRTNNTVYLEIDGKIHQASIDIKQSDSSKKISVQLHTMQQPIIIYPHKSVIASTLPIPQQSLLNQNRQQSSTDTIKSPLSGRIIRVLAQPGQRVTQGQLLVLIESMKMENEICSSISGFIKTILINEGNVVQQNQILIELEKKGEEDAITKSTHEQKTV